MNGIFRRSPLVLLLVIAVAVLAAILAAEIAAFSRNEPATAPRRGSAADAKLLPPVPQVAPEQAYAETTTRPLFVPTRRPAPEVAVAAAPAFQRGQYTLQGVIVVGTNRTAMLREKSSGRVHRVGVGNELGGGVKVFEIQPQMVVLGVGEEKENVPLTVQRPGAPGAPAAAAPAPLAQGPFGAQSSPFPTAPAPGTPGGPPIFPAAPPQQPGAPASPFPRATPPAPAQPPGAPTAPGAAPPAAPPGAPQATTAPMTPEELLARRRARRAQQNQ